VGTLPQAVNKNNLLCVKNLQPEDGTTLTSTWSSGKTLYVNNAEIFYIGEPIVVYMSGTKKQFTTINGINTNAGSHEIHVNNSATTSLTQGSSLVTHYATSEYTPRVNKTAYSLLSDIQAGSNVQFEIGRPTAGFSSFMVGDKILLDDDGNLLTSHDQGTATITAMQLTTSAPYVLTVDTVSRDYHGSSAKIFLLADSFKLQNVQDTSGNSGLNPRRDEFQFGSNGLIY